MLSAVKKANVLDMYLENLCFAPSYSLAKDIVDSGGLGDVYLCKARESADFGSGSKTERDLLKDSWVFDYEKSGGGILLTDGCHPIQYVRHIFGNSPPVRVYSEIIESIGVKKPKGIEDLALVTIRFEGDRIGEIETSYYATGGGADDKAEIYGNQGTIFLDLYRRNPIVVHSRAGYGNLGHSRFLSAEEDDKGWSFPIPEENYSLGYFHEQKHFLQCILRDQRPSINLDDGRTTLEIVLAAYKSYEMKKPISLPLT